MHDELLAVFAEEASEAFARLETLLLDLEGDHLAASRRQALLSEALRLLHGVKGGAMVVEGLEPLVHLLHAAEAHLGALEPSAADASAVDPVLRGLDGGRDLIAALTRGEPAPDLSPLLAALGAPAPDGPEGAPPAGAQEVGDDSGPAPRAEAGPPPPEARGVGEGIRVSAAALDVLIGSLGELGACRRELAREIAEAEDLLARERLRARGTEQAERHELTRGLERILRGLSRQEQRLGRLLRASRDQAGDLRRVRFGILFPGLRRAVRDLLRRTHKTARLHLEGAELRLDKRILDPIKPALLHLVRNAVDHGLELPAPREAAGKEPCGYLRVRGRRRGDRILLEVEDDGAGIDEAALRARARARGVPRAEERSLEELLRVDGLSLREEATSISGRGLGMAAVIASVEELGGTLELHSEAGAGTRFVLSLPASRVVRRGLRVEVAESSFYLPTRRIQRVVRVAPDALVEVDGGPALPLAEGYAPVVDLARLLGLRREAPRRAELRLVVLGSPRGRVALEVEEIHGQAELLVQPLGYPLTRVPHVEGVAVEGEGRGIPVLDLQGLDAALARGEGDAGKAAPAAPHAPRVLVVDDSITTRTLERNILEGAGIQVTVASDGQEALELVAAAAEPFDLVVSDMEMPRVDGPALVSELRRTYSRAELPIVLVTSVQEDAARMRGMEAGANALLAKQRFDHEHLLAVIRSLLGGSGA